MLKEIREEGERHQVRLERLVAEIVAQANEVHAATRGWWSAGTASDSIDCLIQTALDLAKELGHPGKMPWQDEIGSWVGANAYEALNAELKEARTREHHAYHALIALDTHRSLRELEEALDGVLKGDKASKRWAREYLAKAKLREERIKETVTKPTYAELVDILRRLRQWGVSDEYDDDEVMKIAREAKAILDRLPPEEKKP